MYQTYGPNKDNGGKTVYNKQRKRWMQTADIEVVHYEVPEDEALNFIHQEHREGWGPTHLIMFVNVGSSRRFFGMNLSSMTEEELDAFKEMVDASCEAARETIKHRDELAQEAMSDDDEFEVFQRLYRPAPVMVDLTRSE